MEKDGDRGSISYRCGWLAQACMGLVDTEYVRTKSNSLVDLLPTPEPWDELRSSVKR
jgi:hypothetical protein